MALISEINRINDYVCRAFSLGANKSVIDCGLYDDKLNKISNEIIEVRSNQHELLLGDNHTNYLKTVPAGNVSQYLNRPLMLFNGGQPSIYGKTYLTEPDDPSRNYVLSNQNGSGLYLNLLDINGRVIKSTLISNSIYGYFVDSNDTSIYIVCLDSGAYAQTFVYEYDKNNLTQLRYVNLSSNYYYNPQFFHVDDNLIHFIKPLDSIPYYIDKRDPSLKITKYNKSDTTKDLVTGTYQTLYMANFTPPMQNGYMYKIYNSNTNLDSPIKLEALKVDPDTLTYETVANEDIRLSIGENIDEKFTKMYINTYNNVIDHRFSAFKISDTKFIIFYTIRITSGSTLTSELKTSYRVFEVDPSDPKIVTFESAGELNFHYLERVIQFNNDFALIREDTLVHIFKYNDETKTLELSWTLETPNIVSFAYNNNNLYWLDRTTNELHLESDSNTYKGIGTFENNEQFINDGDAFVTNKFIFKIVDSNGTRVSKRVKLVASDNLKFAGSMPDGSGDTSEKIIVTSASADSEVEIHGYNDGIHRIAYYIMEDLA